MRHPSTSPLTRLLLPCAALSLLLTAGCGRRTEGLALANAGQKAAATLSTMYQELAADANDIWELEAFNTALRAGSPANVEKMFSKAAQERLAGQIAALNQRARMAARLADTYASLKALASFDASAEVKASAVGLAGALNLPDIPGSGVSTSGIAGKLAQEIVAWRQSKRLKEGSELLLKSVQGIAGIYKNELAAYKSFPSERMNKIASALDDLLARKLVIPYPLLQQVPDSLGLQWADPKRLPDSIDPLLPAFSLLARSRLQRRVFSSEAAIDAVASALTGLVATHLDFAANRPIDVVTVLGLVEKAQAAFGSINPPGPDKKP